MDKQLSNVFPILTVIKCHTEPDLEEKTVMIKFLVLGDLLGTRCLNFFFLFMFIKFILVAKYLKFLPTIDSPPLSFLLFIYMYCPSFHIYSRTPICPVSSHLFMYLPLHYAGSNILNASSTVALLLFATHSMIFIYTHKMKIMQNRNWKRKVP